MVRRPPRATRTDTPFPYTTLFRSIVRTGDHDVHWHVGEQRRVRATLERPTRGGAAVVSEHGDPRRLDRACGDQDWLGTRAHNTFDLGADMIGRELLACAALDDQHDAGLRISLNVRLDAPAVPMTHANEIDHHDPHNIFP